MSADWYPDGAYWGCAVHGPACARAPQPPPLMEFVVVEPIPEWPPDMPPGPHLTMRELDRITRAILRPPDELPF